MYSAKRFQRISTIFVLSKNKKKYKNKSTEKNQQHFYNLRKICISHRHVYVMHQVPSLLHIFPDDIFYIIYPPNTLNVVMFNVIFVFRLMLKQEIKYIYTVYVVFNNVFYKLNAVCLHSILILQLLCRQ